MVNENNSITTFLKIAIIYLTIMFTFISCGTEDVLTKLNKCEAIELEYNTKVVEMALKDGWEPQSYEFNSTTIGPGFLDPLYDTNFRIFLVAYETYRVEWIDKLTEFNCN